jgi:hypothetical protein
MSTLISIDFRHRRVIGVALQQLVEFGLIWIFVCGFCLFVIWLDMTRFGWL